MQPNTLTKLFQTIADEKNAIFDEWAKEDECFEKPYRPITSMDVLQYLFECNLRKPSNIIHQIDGGMDETHKIICEEVAMEFLDDNFDPWPDLTKEHLLFLIGERQQKHDFPSGLYIGTQNVLFGCNLTRTNKLVASWHREYLEKDLAKKTFKASLLSKKDFFLQVLEEYINCPMSIKTQDYKRCQNNLAFACGQVWSVSDKIPQLHWSDIQDAIQNGVDYDQWIKTGCTYSGAARRIRPIILEEIETKAAPVTE